MCETHLYRLGAFPHGLIAPVEIIWRPVSEEEKKAGDANPPKEKTKVKTRALCIKVHPAAFNEALKTLQEAASRVLEEHRNTSKAECTIQLADLRTQFNIFELSGPQSSRVIWQILSIIGKESRKDAKQVHAIEKKRLPD